MAVHSGGAKLGTRIAVVVSNAMVATHAKLLHVKHNLALAIFHSISDVVSGEVHHTLDPIIGDLHERYGDDGPASRALDFMHNQTGQLQALAGTSALSQGLLWPVSAILNNELAPVVYEAVSGNPHSIPDPGTIAQLGAKGLINDPSFYDGMAKNGFNNSWAGALKQLNEQYPDAGSMLDLVRRGYLTRDTYVEWSIRNGVPAGVAETVAKLIETPLSPADAALALLRGNISEGAALKAAAAYGVTAEDFNVLVGNTGEPLGLEQLLEAHRRGFIDNQRLVKGIIQSRVRNEWVDVAEKLAFSPMTVADAVNAVVQNHISQAEGNAIASQNGLEPGFFDIMVETAGAPLSRTEMEQLFNRGMVTKEQVEQALRESRLKNKYNDLAFALHQRLLEPRSLGEAVVYGSITHAQAVAKAKESGFADDDAEIIVSGAVNRKLETQRMGVVRAVETLYENNAISAETATAITTKMGFEPAEATFIFQAAEFRRQEKLTAAGLSAIRSKFIAHHIDRPTASGLLDAMNIPHQQRDTLLQVWQIEHDANVKVLTPSQLIKANAMNLITDAQLLERLVGMGYHKDDAELLMKGA